MSGVTGYRFGYKVYNYAGGFDDEATEVYSQVHAKLLDYQKSI